MALVFDEQQLATDSIFLFENRLKTLASKFLEGGPLYVTYFSLNENSSTTDRFFNDVEKLFGKGAPLRYNQIKGFPLYGFNSARPENVDEQQIEDINVDGDCIIIPTTIVPHPNDFFSIDHIGTPHLFQVTNVVHDSLKPEGFYQIHYHLVTTSTETYQAFITYQVVGNYVFDMQKVGTDSNPVISEEESASASEASQMVDQMIEAYRSLFYNERHNCFLFHDPNTGWDWFDMCGNEFMAKHSIMNRVNGGDVIVLHQKLIDPQFPIKYNNSIFRWIELGAQAKYLRKFHFLLGPASAYPYSSFVQWGDDDVQVIHPLGVNDVKLNSQWLSYFDEVQFETFMNPETEPLNEYEKIIWKYIHKEDMSISDIPLYSADALISSIRHRDIFLYTPIIIYIIRDILGRS